MDCAHGQHKVADKLLHMILNTMMVKDHVANAERQIHVTKEHRCRFIVTLPFKILSKSMVIHLIHFLTM